MQTDTEGGCISREKSSEDFIQTWLQGVERSAVQAEGAPSSSPSHLGLPHTTFKSDDEGEPRTPHRYLLPAIVLDDEPSPTNTFFTDPTIFDHDQRKNHEEDDGHDRNASASSSDTASVDELGIGKEPAITSFVLGQPRLKGFRNWSTRSETAQSVHSYEPPTEREDALVISPDASVITPTPDDPDKERTVIIVSCLQCTLQNLPCSRTLPWCSRCERNGHGRLCLTQRMKTYEEIVRGDGMRVSDPVLLRIKGEEDSLWLTKLCVRDQASISITACRINQALTLLTTSPLLKKWQDDQDRNNWVLPLNDGRRGNYWTYGNRYAALKYHPGEGVGRKTRMMLKIEVA